MLLSRSLFFGDILFNLNVLKDKFREKFQPLFQWKDQQIKKKNKNKMLVKQNSRHYSGNFTLRLSAILQKTKNPSNLKLNVLSLLICRKN